MDHLRSVLTADHYQPHRFSKFEGFYSKFELPSGARLILVICSIPRAPGKKHNVTVVHVPKDGANIWKREAFPSDITIDSSEHGFTMAAQGIRARLTYSDGVIHYDLDFDGIRLAAISSKRRPWSSSYFDTPAGPLAWLPLPLHWHVHSLGSTCTFSIALPPAAQLAPGDAHGHALVHEEKNWANSFPPAHNWIQARKPSSSICLAGGRTMSMDAFLLGYRNEDLNLELDYRPPFALKLFGLAPFMTHSLDWSDRSFFLSLQDFSYKVVVTAKAPEDTFFCFSSPMPAGFQDSFMAQSLNANVEVKVYRSTGWLFGTWELVCTDEFAAASLEFGGDYYPMKGTEQSITRSL